MSICWRITRSVTCIDTVIRLSNQRIVSSTWAWTRTKWASYREGLIRSKITILIWSHCLSLLILSINSSSPSHWKWGVRRRNNSRSISITYRLKSRKLSSKTIPICPIKPKIRPWLTEVGSIARIRNRNWWRNRNKRERIWVKRVRKSTRKKIMRNIKMIIRT